MIFVHTKPRNQQPTTKCHDEIWSSHLSLHVVMIYMHAMRVKRKEKRNTNASSSVKTNPKNTAHAFLEPQKMRKNR